MDISIVICTYNREQLLVRCLESVAALNLDELQGEEGGGDVSYEILVVDNASTDNTKNVVEKFRGINNLRYLFEAQQGKSYALNLALREAKGQTVIFADDDICLEQQTIAEFWSSYQNFGQTCDWFGGCVKLDWQATKAPAWLNHDIQTVLDGALGVHDLGEQSRRYQPNDKHPIGALMMVTRRLVDKVGEFRTDLGPSGSRRGASDDTDYIIRAQAQGLQGYYVAASKALHYVDPTRLTLKGFYRYGYAKGINAQRADSNKIGSFSWVRVLGQSARGLLQVIRGRTGNARVCLLNIGFEFGKRKARKA